MSTCNGKCDLYRPGDDNVWVERGTPEAPGICLLDTMSREQVIYTLERDDRARADLLRVTSDPELRALAEQVPRLDTREPVDVEQSVGNRMSDPMSIPFHALFRGQPPFAQ